VVVGIGIPRRFSSTVTTAKYMSVEEFHEMEALGAVGDLALQFFDSNGKIEQFRSFNSRVAGFPLDEFGNVENRLGIAGGKNKAEAVLGAIRGNYVNMLVVDLECAQELLKMGGAL
jgi:DNA-binding transcriptional regulator LsrR (DeoR family)